MTGPRLFYTTIGVALAFSLGGAVSAQEGGKGEGRRGGRGDFGGFGGGPGGMINKTRLLGSSQVRTELKVADEQGKKLDEVLASHTESSRDLFGRGPREGTDEERKKAREENLKKRADLLKATEEKLAGILDKTQSKRLDEILLQQQGADALVSEPVVAALSLKPEQVEKIKAAFVTRDEEMAKLRPAGGRRGGEGGGGAPGGNFEEMRAKMDKLRKDTETAALAVLSKEQGEGFAKLKGTAFELDRSQLQGGFGGGRGGRGEGGGGGGGKKARPPDDEI